MRIDNQDIIKRVRIEDNLDVCWFWNWKVESPYKYFVVFVVLQDEKPFWNYTLHPRRPLNEKGNPIDEGQYYTVSNSKEIDKHLISHLEHAKSGYLGKCLEQVKGRNYTRVPEQLSLFDNDKYKVHNGRLW